MKKKNNNNSGFTLVEAMVVVGLILLISAILAPSVGSRLSDYRLKRAVLDLYANFQLARMRAIQTGGEYAIVFVHESEMYRLVSSGADRRYENGAAGSDDVIEKTIRLAAYGGGVRFGFGRADQKATVSGGIPKAGDEISYQDDTAAFTAQGMSSRMGYVYLENNQRTAYAISTPTLAGVIRIKHWNSRRWE